MPVQILSLQVRHQFWLSLAGKEFIGRPVAHSQGWLEAGELGLEKNRDWRHLGV